MPVTEEFLAANNAAIDQLAATFATYAACPIDRIRIISWLKAMGDEAHAAVALKALQQMDYYSRHRASGIAQEMDNTLRLLIGDDYDNSFFCALGSPGKSGDAMLRVFRMSTHRGFKNFDSKFIVTSEIVKLPPGANVILFDDFIGTGDQAHGVLQAVSEICPPNVQLWLAPMVITTTGASRLMSTYDVQVVPGVELSPERSPLHPDYPHLTQDEKTILRTRSLAAGGLGHGDLALNLCTFDRIPNNTLALFRASTKWPAGLFTR